MDSFSNINGKMRLRRLRVLRIDPTYALAIFAGKTELRMEGLPDDAEVMSVSGDWLTNSIELMVYSDSFEIVPPMQEPPVFILSFRVKQGAN